MTLTTANLPTHNHLLQKQNNQPFNLQESRSGKMMASSNGPDEGSPNGNALATFPQASPIYDNQEKPPTIAMADNTVITNLDLSNYTSNIGGSQEFDIHPPFLAIKFIIATVGFFSPRN